MKYGFLAFAFTLLFSNLGFAKIKTEVVLYKEGSTQLQGYLAYDDSLKGKLPGVVIVHEWKGENDYVERRAREIAQLGYVGFAADIYGKGVRPSTNEEAGKLAGKYKSDRPLLRARVRAAYDWLAAKPQVDSQKMFAMGYCFGGTTALELARSGAALLGTISFHGGLDNPTPEDAKKINGKVLVMTGAIDPMVPADQVASFSKEMNEAKVDYQLISFANTVHAFTNPASGDDISKGIAYNALSDARSWQYMKDFFHEILTRP